MDKEVKNTISHRLRALDQFKVFIDQHPDLFLGDVVPEGEHDPEWDVFDFEEDGDHKEAV